MISGATEALWQSCWNNGFWILGVRNPKGWDVDWGKLPDLAAVILFASAFAAVARRSRAPVSALWLTGWLMIAVHFATAAFAPLNSQAGAIATFISVCALVWAGMLFNWASEPDRAKRSSFWMLLTMMGANTFYLVLIAFDPKNSLALTLAAVTLGALPLALALIGIRGKSHPLRWATVAFYCMLSVFLLAFQDQPVTGRLLAENGVLFTVYFACCVHFWFAYRRPTAGAFVTIAGFFTWASSFIIAPSINTFLPALHLENEVWNLPKYIVAVGMILLLLEEQIEHNQYLALHDELTGLPNRRLFQDRLNNALERARRTGAKTALLLVDLDHFKQVNDTHGHHAGDRVLEHVGRVFLSRVRRSDTVARTGGDEFAVILDEPVSRIVAEHVAQSLVELLDEPFILLDRTIPIGASIGIALFPDDATDAEGLCISADLQMYDYKHKRGSGNGINLSRPIPVASFTAVDTRQRLQGFE
jgi:diguanylate cyclase